MLEGYMEHCRNALLTYGDLVVGKLASPGHYNMWARSLKAEDSPEDMLWVGPLPFHPATGCLVLTIIGAEAGPY